MLGVKGTLLREIEEDEHHEEHAEEGYEEEEEDDAHHHDGVDPHAWLEPENANLWLDEIAAELAAIDAENAVLYLENASAAKAPAPQQVGLCHQTKNAGPYQ